MVSFELLNFDVLFLEANGDVGTGASDCSPHGMAMMAPTPHQPTHHPHPAVSMGGLQHHPAAAIAVGGHAMALPPGMHPGAGMMHGLRMPMHGVVPMMMQPQMTSR